jgi:hypothetical protein
MLAVLGITVPLINEVDTVAPAAVLTTVTFTAADGVTQTQAREELLIVVARHFQNTLGIDLSGYVHSRASMTTVPILLWFKSSKEAAEKKKILEISKSALLTRGLHFRKCDRCVGLWCEECAPQRTRGLPHKAPFLCDECEAADEADAVVQRKLLKMRKQLRWNAYDFAPLKAIGGHNFTSPFGPKFF